jgi:hypothetical protein
MLAVPGLWKSGTMAMEISKFVRRNSMKYYANIPRKPITLRTMTTSASQVQVRTMLYLLAEDFILLMLLVEYPDQIDTPLEFAKPLGTGTDLWPTNMVTYAKDGKYSSDCIENDELQQWFADNDNLDSFAHISHTFTHMDQDNATYADALREITWNTAWLKSAGISKAKRYTVDGIIPPAITGLHNGDALRAWAAAGIKHVVGDNTRPILLNQVRPNHCSEAVHRLTLLAGERTLAALHNKRNERLRRHSNHSKMGIKHLLQRPLSSPARLSSTNNPYSAIFQPVQF